MSALANITINDGQATPVAHTFTVTEHGKGFATYRETGVSSLLAACVITVLNVKTKLNSGLEKYRIKIMLPAMEVVTGSNSSGYTAAPKLAYSLQSTQEFIIPLRATDAQRKDIRAYTAAITSNSQVFDLIVSGVMPY